MLLDHCVQLLHRHCVPDCASWRASLCCFTSLYGRRAIITSLQRACRVCCSKLTCRAQVAAESQWCLTRASRAVQLPGSQWQWPRRRAARRRRCTWTCALLFLLELQLPVSLLHELSGCEAAGPQTCAQTCVSAWLTSCMARKLRGKCCTSCKACCMQTVREWC